MRWIPDVGGRFPKRLFFDSMSELDQECERLVEYVHFKKTQTRFKPPLGDDTLQILIEQSADIDLYGDLDPGTEAETEFRPGKRPLVIMSSAISTDSRRRNRMRTGLAHEWFHATFHRTAWELLWAKQRVNGVGVGRSVGKCRRETIVAAPSTTEVAPLPLHARGDARCGHVCR